MTLISPPTSGPYGTLAEFTAQLDGPAEGGSGIPNQVVEFSLGSQRRQIVTDANGRASVAFPLIGIVGQDVLQVSFAGNATYKGSIAFAPFTINRQATSLILDPQPGSGQYSDNTNLQATLFAGADRRLPNTSVFFVAGTPAETLSATSTNVTDYAGRAPAGPVNLPAGIYPVTVYFLGAIPLGNGQTIILSDSRYLASTGTGSLVQSAEDSTVTYTGQTTVPSGGALATSALVVQADDGSPGDLTRASVEYVVRNGLNQVVATVTGSVTAGGVSVASIPGLPDGKYTLTAQVVGGYFASPISAPTQITVGVPTAVTLSTFSVDGAGDLRWLPWLIVVVGIGAMLAAGLKQHRSIRHSA